MKGRHETAEGGCTVEWQDGEPPLIAAAVVA